MKEILKQDCYRYGIKFNIYSILRYYFSSSSFKALIIFRLSNFFYRKKMKLLAAFLQQKNIRINSCEIGYETNIGPGLVIRHPMGIVISGECMIGSNLTISQNVTIGNKNGKSALIGDNCDIGVGAVILGEIKIGNNVIIGANSVVIKNIKDNCIAAGVPAKLLTMKKGNKGR